MILVSAKLDPAKFLTVWVSDVDKVEWEYVVSGVSGAGRGLVEAVEVEAAREHRPYAEELEDFCLG